VVVAANVLVLQPVFEIRLFNKALWNLVEYPWKLRQFAAPSVVAASIQLPAVVKIDAVQQQP
jgi:hypothetical protein